MTQSCTGWGTKSEINNETIEFVITLSFLFVKTTAVTSKGVGVLKGK